MKKKKKKTKNPNAVLAWAVIDELAAKMRAAATRRIETAHGAWPAEAMVVLAILDDRDRLAARVVELEAQVADARDLLRHHACGYARPNVQLADWLARTAPKEPK